MTRKQDQISTKDFIQQLIPTRVKISHKSKSQKDFIKTIDDNQITICSGPAGTGKSFLSIAKAIQLLQNKSNKYEKIIIINPIVEADEKIGFLKGSLRDKISPYVFSSQYIIDKLIGVEARNKLEQENLIEYMVLAYLRGVNIDNSILILEEAQNTSRRQIKTLLTRIGYNTKFIISGDLEQSDREKDKKNTGLYDALTRLDNVPGIGAFSFQQEDVVRNPIISKILETYTKDETESRPKIKPDYLKEKPPKVKKTHEGANTFTNKKRIVRIRNWFKNL